MTEPLKSLDARYYVDPAIFAIEKQHLLATTWQFAGHESQVKSPGDYFTFSIAGENLFCIRDREGNLNCFYNVCQHRAHELVEGDGNARLLICPYHTWTYELSGELRMGPNVLSTPGFDRSKICLTSVRLENFHGFLFVNLDDDAKPMDEWFPGAREELASYVPNILDLTPVEYVEVFEKTNWKVSVENYSECYHCSRNHPTFANGVIKPSTYDIQPQGYCLRHTTECQDDLSDMTYEIDLESNDMAGKYSSWFLWPMFSFQVYPGNVLNTYHWRVGDAVDEVVMYRGWYAFDEKSEAIAHQLAVQDRDTTVAEDIRLVESIQRGMNSRGYKPGPLVLDPNGGVNSEHSIKALQEWTKEAVDQYL
ncbi:MAG: aromatic ring-hydroxylating dioxygenase subunit alpha [Halieaceae bacterium]|jgi:phenylpropionate dioxygenase-like ring-hydroxylating dioxygenase large terminal subunit